MSQDLRRSRPRFAWWHEVALLGILIVLLGLAEWFMPGFLSWPRQMFLSRHLWESAILALGMTLIIIAGGIDLSVGAAMGLSAVTFGIAFQLTGNLLMASIACITTGTVGGFLNGWLIARFNPHPLIVTLATYAAFRGAAEGISQGASYSGFPDSFAVLARGQLGGIPIPGLVFIILLAVNSWVLGRMAFGRKLYAIGNNEQAARFSGILVGRIRCQLFTHSGFLAGLAALLYVSRFNSATADVGKGFELAVITAVVVGGTSIFGGRGNLLGTTLGLVLIHETRSFVGRYWRMDEIEPIVIGSLLIASVLAYRWLTPQRSDAN